jgi:hypothetical protein
MSTTVLLLLSAAMIGTGLSLVWRDLHVARRNALAGSPETERGSGVDVGSPAAKVAPSAAPATRAPLTTLGGKLAALLSRRGAPESDLPRPDAALASATARQWAELQPAISSAVEQVNAVLAQAGIAIGAPEEPTWSPSNGYGADWLIEARGRPLARLRLECTPDGKLNASVVARDESLADDINGDAGAPASGASIGRVSDLISECLKPATAYALRNRGEAGRRATEGDWKAVEGTVIAAMKVANGAILEAGARLLPIAPPTWDPAQGLHRMPISVQMFGRDIARMHIDRLGEEMEVAVGLPDARLASLGRRQRLAVEGMTTHALAEMIAACAWPAIAHDRETRPSP